MADPSYVTGGVLTDGDALVCIEETSLVGVAGLQWGTSTGTKNWSQYEDLLIIATVSASTGNGSKLLISVEGLGGSTYFSYQDIMGSGTSVNAGDGLVADGTLCYGSTTSTSGAIARIHNHNSLGTKKIISKFLDNRAASNGNSGIFGTCFLLDWAIDRIDIDFGSTTGATGSKAWLYGILPRMGLPE